MFQAKRRRTGEDRLMVEDRTEMGVVSSFWEVGSDTAVDAVEKELNGPMEDLMKACAVAEVVFASERKKFPYYAVYMLALATEMKLQEARFLWRRAEAVDKEESDQFISAFEAVQCVLQDDIEGALRLTESALWTERTEPLARKLTTTLRRESRDRISRAYTVISITTCARLLGLSEEKAVEYVTQPAQDFETPWKKDDSYLLPTHLRLPSEVNGTERVTTLTDQLLRLQST